MYGQGAAEAHSPEWPQLYHLYLPDGVTPFPADRLPLVRAIRGESTAETEILVRRSQAADSLLMLVSGRPIRGVAGDVVGGVIVCHDVTARAQADKAVGTRAEELARSNRELQRLAYVAAHDLQEPLGMIASYVELVAERYKGRLDEKADKYHQLRGRGDRQDEGHGRRPPRLPRPDRQDEILETVEAAASWSGRRASRQGHRGERGRGDP